MQRLYDLEAEFVQLDQKHIFDHYLQILTEKVTSLESLLGQPLDESSKIQFNVMKLQSYNVNDIEKYKYLIKHSKHTILKTLDNVNINFKY